MALPWGSAERLGEIYMYPGLGDRCSPTQPGTPSHPIHAVAMAGQHPSSHATIQDIKLDTIHVDDKQDDVKGEKTQPVLESAWAHTPPLTLARLFWKAILICAGILAGALFDGKHKATCLKSQPELKPT